MQITLLRGTMFSSPMEQVPNNNVYDCLRLMRPPTLAVNQVDRPSNRRVVGGIKVYTVMGAIPPITEAFRWLDPQPIRTDPPHEVITLRSEPKHRGGGENGRAIRGTSPIRYSSRPLSAKLQSRAHGVEPFAYFRATLLRRSSSMTWPCASRLMSRC